MKELVVAMLKSNGRPETAITPFIDNLSQDACGNTNEEFLDYENRFVARLKNEISRLIQADLGTRGVLCLSEAWDNPLLWSHYGDQHKGICIEYDISDTRLDLLRRVDYNAARSIRMIDLYLWHCKGDKKAEKRATDTYFYAKAPEWSYEKEWRDVNVQAGINKSKFRITAIHMGMRAEFVWRWVLIKLLNQDHNIKLYQMDAYEENFDLFRKKLDRQELESRGIEIPENLAIRGFETQFAKGVDSIVLNELAMTLSSMKTQPPGTIFSTGNLINDIQTSITTSQTKISGNELEEQTKRIVQKALEDGKRTKGRSIF